MSLKKLAQADILELTEFDTTSRTCHLNLDTPSPYEVYLVLKDAFGRSTSEEFDDTKSQWGYVLKTDGGFVQIYDWKLSSWSLAVHLFDGNEEAGRKIAQAVLKDIINHAQRLKPRVKAAVSTSQASIIHNPFALYYDTAEELLSLASFDPTTEDALRELKLAAIRFGVYNTPALYRSALLMLLASFEGLLNIIYELYLKKSLRDERIYERLAREQIDIKLRLAPVYCECFTDQPIEPTFDEFRNFQSLVNLRNDFVHANLTKSMRFPVVVEDDIEFVVPQLDKELSIGLPRSFADLQAPHLDRAKQIIDDIISLVLKHMKPRYRREFSSFMHNEYIQVEYEDGELVVVR